MTIRTYKVTLDTKNAIAPEPVYLRQGDKTGAVVIDATLMDNGSPVSLTGLTPSFMANTADGKSLIADTSGFNIVNATGGEFTYQIPSQLGSVPGKIKIAYFSFTDSNGNQSTFDIAFAVSPSVDMTQESAKDWISNLSDIISQYNQWVTDAHSSWQDFVNANKEIIESIDPGGKVLAELIDARVSPEGDTYSSLGRRLDYLQSDPNKLKFMSLSVTYNSNEPNRYSNIISQYKSLGTPINFINMCSISSSTASDVASAPYNDLQAAITQAISNGYRIELIKPHVGPNNNDGFNKTAYLPDNTDTFFSNYKNLLLDQAKLADANNIPALCLETELNQLAVPAYYDKWQDIVNSIRSAYPKLKLTVASAGAYDNDSQKIFNLVDIIGINWYPSYVFKQINTSVDIPSEAAMSQQLLSSHINDSENPGSPSDVSKFLQMSDTFRKPIWITETGVMPKPDGLATLISQQSSSADDYTVVAAAMSTMAHTLGRMGPVCGLSWWSSQSPFNPAPEDGKTTGTDAQNVWKALVEEMYIDEL